MDLTDLEEWWELEEQMKRISQLWINYESDEQVNIRVELREQNIIFTN